MQLAISNDRRSALWFIGFVLLLALFAARCAHAPATPERFTPPAATWPSCAENCIAQGGVFVGILLPTEHGPAICACTRPQPAAAPVPWGGGT